MAVDATLGGVSSDSYISNAGADAYWLNRNNATWAAASSEEADAALREATQYLDAKYEWVGTLKSTDQALDWPRTGAYDREDRDISDIIPTKVKQATAELALQALSSTLVDPSADRGGQTKREKVGDIEVEYFPGASSQKLYAFVDMLLKGIVVNNGSTVNLVRA